jgi:Tfp pilus assembly protein PilP
MARFRLWVFAAALCLCTGSILAGCGGSEEAPAPAVKQVVKGKIPPVAQKAASAPVQTTAQPQPAAPVQAPVKPQPAAPVQAAVKPEPPAAVGAATTGSAPVPTLPKESAAAPAAGTALTTAADQVKPGPSEEELALAAGLKKLLSVETEYAYEPEGKTDPFAPVFDSGEPEDLEGNKDKQEEREKRIPQSPIEMVDLTQLKLTGVILAPSGNRALVQDATGKGYVVQKGTYIGNREGQVTEVLSDRLIVSEKTRDDLGRPVTEAREIKLPKPPGEM